MVKFEHTTIHNVEGALRGMRNPKDSWDNSDSRFCSQCILTKEACSKCNLQATGFEIGQKDLELACRLIAGGTEHRKFLRQIMVCVDITAPRYWWQEFDTYKVGTTANSCSTMHKLKAYPIIADMFTVDELEDNTDEVSTWVTVIQTLEKWRNLYNETGDIKYLRKMKQLMPEGFLQKRTVTMNYENILSFDRQRGDHRLQEWFKDSKNWWRSLPYITHFLGVKKR